MFFEQENFNFAKQTCKSKRKERQFQLLVILQVHASHPVNRKSICYKTETQSLITERVFVTKQKHSPCQQKEYLLQTEQQSAYKLPTME